MTTEFKHILYPGGGTGSTAKMYAGYCVDSKGKDQNSELKKLPNGYKTADNCLKACSDPSGPYYSLATGCEYHAPGCWVHTAEVVSAGGSSKAKRESTCFVLTRTGIDNSCFERLLWL